MFFKKWPGTGFYFSLTEISIVRKASVFFFLKHKSSVHVTKQHLQDES